MATNARKTLTDAGYIVIGLGVLGFQQAQVRGRQVKEQVERTADCVGNHARDARTSVEERSRTARDQAETSVRNTVARTRDLGSEFTKRVEPMVEQVQSQLHDLPERVVQAIEPVTARVRELSGNAA